MENPDEDIITRQFDVSVILCTYNRCEMLPQAMESLLAQQTGGVRYELIVVDNNSTDATREVIQSFIRRGHSHIRYIFEGTQGLPHARNAGIKSAHAPIIAFTDDDVRVAKDWVGKIKQAFDDYPKVDLVGGKVLPRWEREPPAWMTPTHWGPLALQDYGEAPFLTNSKRPVCLVGANMSLRRAVFERIGLFNGEFVRMGASSTEDHELQLRLWLAGGQGIYVPDVAVTADVQAERLTKAYHRLWHSGHGRSCAMMHLHEMYTPEGYVVKQQSGDTVKLFGAPSFIYRELLRACAWWFSATLFGSEGDALLNEDWARYLIGYIRQSYKMDCAKRDHYALSEVGNFGGKILRKKWLAVVSNHKSSAD